MTGWLRIGRRVGGGDIGHGGGPERIGGRSGGGGGGEALTEVILADVADAGRGAEIREGVTRDRIVSHSDPDMCHGGKSAARRFDGHKLDVMIDEVPNWCWGRGPGR
jgi:hypothetical protein